MVIVRRADFTARVAPPIRDEAVRADDWAVGAFRSGPSEGIFTWSWRVIRTMRGTSSRSGYDRFAQALSMLLLMNIFSRQQHVGKVCAGQIYAPCTDLRICHATWRCGVSAIDGARYGCSGRFCIGGRRPSRRCLIAERGDVWRFAPELPVYVFDASRFAFD